jgi:asparagine synthase (glutamine-hydrolysing)
MPGIFGIIAKRTIGNESKMLDDMSKIMMHEPFYNAAIYINEQMGCYVGGISIKGSFADCMPIYNKNQDLVLFFAGECYSDPSAISELRSKGYSVVQEKANYIINLYEERGEDFVSILNGWFSGVLIDTITKRVILFNDRYGIQRVYYHETDNALYFASEAKALLKVLPQLRKFDDESLGQYFIYNCVLDLKTLFSGIFVLSPASFWVISKDVIDKRKYFNLSVWENQEPLPKDQFFDALNEAFLNVLPRYFLGDKIGMAITGGLDSRLILACYKPEPGSLPCYTFNSMYNTSLDFRVSSKIAKILDQPIHILKLDEKFLADFPHHAARAIYITDGLANIQNSDELYLAGLSREIAPVKMTGKYGSEVLQKPQYLKNLSCDNQLVNDDFRKYVIQGKEIFKKILYRNLLSSELSIDIPIVLAGFTLSEFSQLTLRSPYLDNEFIKCLYKAPQDLSIDSNREFQWQLISKVNPQLFALRTNKGIIGKAHPIIDPIIRRLYQTAIRFDKYYNSESLPLNFHHHVARLDKYFSFIHPYKIFAGYNWFRHYRLWFRTCLSGYLREILLDDRTLKRHYFNAVYLRKIVNDHTKGKGNYLKDISTSLSIELVNRLLIEDI